MHSSAHLFWKTRNSCSLSTNCLHFLGTITVLSADGQSKSFNCQLISSEVFKELSSDEKDEYSVPFFHFVESLFSTQNDWIQHWHTLVGLLKILFRGLKEFFQENIRFSRIWQLSHLCKKLSIHVGKRHFYEIKSVDAHCLANLSPLTNSKKNSSFFQKAHLYCPKTEISNVFTNFFITVTLYGNHAIAWWLEKFKDRAVGHLDIINWRKALKNVGVEWMIFFPHHQYGGK